MVRFWRIAAVVSVVVALAVNVYIAWGSSLSFMYDEIGTVIHGRTALGLETPQLNTPGYYPGWGVLLAPLWLVTSNVFTFYKLALVVGLAISMLTIWPLARIAVRLSGVTPAQGVVAGAIVMALPPRAVQADYILSERLVTLLVVVATLVAFRLCEKPTFRNALLLSLLAGLSLFSHARMQVFVAAVALWLVCLLVHSLVSRRWRVALVFLVGLVATGVLAVLANKAALWFHEQLVPWKFLQAEGFFEKVAAANPRFWVDTFAGEAWTQMVGSFGVVVVGVVAVTATLWKELRSRAVGPAAFVLIAAGSMYVLSCLNWGNERALFTMEWRRFDYWIYGRYIDPVFAVLVLAGVCAAIQAVRSRAILGWSWVLVAGISLVTILVVAPDAPTWAYATPAHIPGAIPWWWALPDGEFPQPGPIPSFTNENRFWLIATLCALVPLVVWTLLATLGRVAPRLGARLTDTVRAVGVTALVLVLGTTASAVADTSSDRFHDHFDRATPVVGELRSILAEHPEADIAYDNNCPRRRSSMNAERNWVMWWMLPTIVKRQWEWGDDIVFSCPTGEPAYVTGAVMLRDRPFPLATVWILPGDLLDSLRESGDLPPVAKVVR
ncbi:hypothetical protein FB381_1223 [Nocardioides albertanoniae]|uniref:4-amino-4-deoxy-L-arabinose transferase-like glycosyltransferase n=1 Tax=Nocardioides albertanoniae TaxID=1175486 RepID=A0A543A439_9ACTN|nr:hypothetical protein [Nocardioides albertanoniae]TQL67348.1 hypothetical protein FB381_1223 [Nocardioides albertanoniae]